MCHANYEVVFATTPRFILTSSLVHMLHLFSIHTAHVANMRDWLMSWFVCVLLLKSAIHTIFIHQTRVNKGSHGGCHCMASLCKSLWFVRLGVWFYVLIYCPFTVFCDLLFLFRVSGHFFGEFDAGLPVDQRLVIVDFVVIVSVVVVVVVNVGVGFGVRVAQSLWWIGWRDTHLGYCYPNV